MRRLRRFGRPARLRAGIIGAVVAVAAIAGGFMYVHGSTTAAQYRTAAATLGTIRQTLSLTGNLTPIAQSDVSFLVSGTVTAVDVSVGETVSAGQVLATIDPASLQTALTQAQANLAAAQAKQTADRSSTTASTAAQQVASAETSLANDETAYSDTVAVDNQTIATDQQAIASDQAAVGRDGQSVAADQQQWNSDGCGTSSTTPACQTDQQNLSAAQAQQAKDQQALSTADATLANDQVRTRQSNDQAAARVSADRTALSNAESSSNSASSGAAQAATAAQDQASVTQAELAVSTAQDNLDDATLTAPAAGEVAEVGTAVGSTVGGSSSAASSAASTSSSTSQFIILTPGAFEVTGTVSDSVVSEVAVGQRAVVTAAGSTNGLPATVTSVGVIATISSGVATFPVTVEVTGSHPSLRDGMSATVTVVINELVGVLTVPTSAVHTNGSTSTVEVLQNGQPTAVTVTVGSADSSRTQITSGLSSGQEVVIATVTSTVPSTSSSGGAFRRGLGGGGGGGFVPGGG